VRIGSIGLGRIGRNLVRQVEQHPSLEIVVIPDYASADGLAYLLKYDSIYGRFEAEVSHTEDSISIAGGVMTVDGKQIQMLMERVPAELPWKELAVVVVIEATGVFRLGSQIQKHIDGGAKRVV
jgi:glyceraldehyde 3-phosphate dehydrogenase